MRQWLREHRHGVSAPFDAVAWFPAIFLGVWLRYEMTMPPGTATGALIIAMVAALLQVLFGIATGLYRHRWRYGSIDELGGTATVLASVSVLTSAANRFLLGHRIPFSAAIIGAPIALVIMVGVRYVWRAQSERRQRPGSHPGSNVQRVIVFGAGSGGEQVIAAMMVSPHSPFLPVAILDDSTQMRNRRIKGVPVRGTRRDMAAVARHSEATSLVIAIPSADGELIRELAELARENGLTPLVLPPVADLFGKIGLSDIRPLTERDLLGRREIDIDIDITAHLLTGRRVLVTGAGGSIGSEICRQVHTYGPSQLIMLDHDDTALHALQLSLTGRALLQDPCLVLADVRDPARMFKIFEEFRPEVVFHAAALKHLSMLEMHADEGFKTNVVGSHIALSAALHVGATHFVNISTDKAANPTSVLGKTKRMAERLTASAATITDGTYLSVRFGNVLGSRGSVLPTMRAQIAAGGPVTITDPDVTRYFMTVEEAVRLVLCAAGLGENGETLVLDMGSPVRILDVARQLIAESDRPIEIVYTGLRPGEKLDEQLLDHQTNDVRPKHPLVSHTSVEPLSDKSLEAISLAGLRSEASNQPSLILDG